MAMAMERRWVGSYDSVEETTEPAVSGQGDGHVEDDFQLSSLTKCVNCGPLCRDRKEGERER